MPVCIAVAFSTLNFKIHLITTKKIHFKSRKTSPKMAYSGSQKNSLLIFLAPKSGVYTSFMSLAETCGWRVLVIADCNALDSVTSTHSADLTCLVLFDPLELSLSKKDFELIEAFHRDNDEDASNRSLFIASGFYENFDTSTLVARAAAFGKLTAKFGIDFRHHNCVIRPNPYKQYHPREAQLKDFIANRGFAEWFARDNQEQLESSNASSDNNTASIVYAQGCILNAASSKSTTVILTSSKWALPGKQPTCILSNSQARRLVALGSAAMLSERYINLEQNKRLAVSLLDLVSNQNFPLNLSDAKTLEIPELVYTADPVQLCEQPISSLQEMPELPADKHDLLDKRLFALDNRQLPELLEAVERLGLQNEPLTLIKPKFEVHELPLEPATHGFLLRPLTRR